MAYVYRHVRLDTNVPFYIGIGSDDKYRRAYARKKRNDYWKNISSKTEYRVDILLDDIDYETAKYKEIEFIKIYGRADLKEGILCNLTNGGDGTVGLIISQDMKNRISEKLKGKSATWNLGNTYCSGKKCSDEAKLKISEKNKGKKRSEASRLKMSNSHKGVKLSKSQVEKIRQKNTGKKRSEESKKRMSESQKGNKNNLGKKASEETKLKMSSSQKGRIVSSEARKNMSNAHKGQVAWNKGKTNIYSKETKENISKSLIKFHKDKVKKHE